MPETIKLDDWKPSEYKPKFRIPSKWRKEQNDGKAPISDPGLDDVKKIKAHILSGVPDKEILDTFNITSYVLKKIKLGKYKVDDDTNEIKPSFELAKEIKEMINSNKFDQDEIRINYNINKWVFNSIKNGTYLPPKKKEKPNGTKKR